MRIECPNCGRLQMDDLGANLTIQPSTAFMYSSEPPPRFMVEVKWFRCYKFNIVYGEE